MPSTIYRKEAQVRGQFNNGAILENKPVQLTHEQDKLQPYSNLFYWAHAWSDDGSLIGEHPHQGFEIISIVLKGEIEHFDSAHEGWKKLKTGDAQIIRAGNGISHAERITSGSEMFQIWFDPDLSKSLSKPASYNDYPATAFPVVKVGGLTYKTYKDEGAPLLMDTQGVTMKEVAFGLGHHKLALQQSSYAGIYLIEGQIGFNNVLINANDFVHIQNESGFSFEVLEAGRLFIIENPLEPGYRTYASRYKTATA